MTNKAKRFYSLVTVGNEADIDIYGDIYGESGWPCESDYNVFRLSRQLEELPETVTQINVNINSYGGEVAEGIAIYNALVRNKAKVVTRCDGMACSIASVIFMAGDERVMYEPSMLMIHNASSGAYGTAAELRKAADDNEKITSMSKAAYLQSVNITEEELTALMDAETWITPAEALNMGFATKVESREESGTPSQSVRASVFSMIRQATEPDDQDDPDEPEEPEVTVEPEEPEQAVDVDDDPDDTKPDDVDDTTDDDPDNPDDTDTNDDQIEAKANQAFASFVMAAFKH